MAIKRTNRCLHKSAFKSFIEADPYSVLGRIHDAFHGQGLTSTDEAWLGEINLMQNVLLPWKDEEAEIIFEYDIPRLGKRIDVLLLLRELIFCLEFKISQKDALQTDVEQVMDYALDLKNFHRYSHARIIVPILIPTKHKSSSSSFTPSIYSDSIFNPLITGASMLQKLIQEVLQHADANIPGTITAWIISHSTPTPTIIEVARSLYESHSVEDITRHEAVKVTTDATIAYILDVINHSKRQREKSICFVTGVPGAGKTLVGLDLAVKQSYQDDGAFNEDDGAAYFSGNGPLVDVLTEVLARDNYKKSREKGDGKKLSDSRQEVSKFIQIIHRSRDNMLAKIKNPVVNGKLEIDPDKAVKLQQSGYGEVEHVAIFNEAQRAWTHKRIADYLKRGGTYGNKLKVANFPMSEAAFLIWSLDQREDWATIVCLSGGGQEINTGKAGISEWIATLSERFPHWNGYIFDKLTEQEYAEGKVNELLEHNPNVVNSDKLHLGMSLRSFRTERLSAFVHSLLSFNPDAAELYKNVVSHGYPIKLTRRMDKARKWLRQQARGTQQTGILISKDSARFKPFAVHVLSQCEDKAVHWFLEDKTDVCSSNYLEEVATEIQVQGLEVDFACVLWDADMRYDNGKWTFWKFNGKTQWTPEKNYETHQYMLNAYRALLTRVRQGIVICVPKGNERTTHEDFPETPTRQPFFYDSTYEYFKRLGLAEI